MLNITHYQRNANQNHDEVTLHTNQDGCYPKVYKPTFSLSFFTFIRRLFSSSSLSAIRVVSSAYPRLLIFLPAILIPACASSSPDQGTDTDTVDSSYSDFLSFACVCVCMSVLFYTIYPHVPLSLHQHSKIWTIPTLQGFPWIPLVVLS